MRGDWKGRREKGWIKRDPGFFWLPHLPQLVLHQLVRMLSYRFEAKGCKLIDYPAGTQSASWPKGPKGPIGPLGQLGKPKTHVGQASNASSILYPSGTSWLFHPQLHRCLTCKAVRSRYMEPASMNSQVSWREFTEEYNGSFTIHLPCLAPMSELVLAFSLEATWGRVGTHLQVSPNYSCKEPY